MLTTTVPALTTRLASAADRPRLMACLLELARVSPYTRGPVDEAHLAIMLARMQANPDAGFIVAEDEDGLIVGLLVLMLFDDLVSAERGAAEVCWYVSPDHRDGLGLHLLSHAEAWACARGATYIQMMAPETRFETVYRRRGYVLTNRVYERRLPCRG